MFKHFHNSLNSLKYQYFLPTELRQIQMRSSEICSIFGRYSTGVSIIKWAYACLERPVSNTWTAQTIVVLYVSECLQHGRPHVWVRGGTCPPLEMFKNCLLISRAKRSVDELFMLYFHNLSSASAGFAQTSTGRKGLYPIGGLSSSDPYLPTPEKKSAGAHGFQHTIQVDREMALEIVKVHQLSGDVMEVETRECQSTGC